MTPYEIATSLPKRVTIIIIILIKCLCQMFLTLVVTWSSLVTVMDEEHRMA